MAILTIIRLTLLEALRRRLFAAIAALTALVVILTGWGFQHLLSALNCGGAGCAPEQTAAIAATLLILIAFMFSFVFSLAAVFVAAPAIALEIESGVMLALLPRPIRRSEIVAGKCLGLLVIVGGYATVTMGLEFSVVRVFTGYVPPHPIAAVLYLCGESVVLLLAALLASTRLAPMTGGIVALLLFGVAWIGGIAQGVGIAVQSSSIANAGTTSSLLLPTDGLWRGALYSLEPAALIAASGAGRAASANPFLVSGPPSTAYVLWALAWMAAMFALAAFSFSRREL